jgi:hypothetical protein
MADRYSRQGSSFAIHMEEGLNVAHGQGGRCVKLRKLERAVSTMQG